VSEDEDLLEAAELLMGGGDDDAEAPVANEIQLQAMEWFTSKVADPACPSCRQEAWLISSALHTYPAYDPVSGGVFFDEGLSLVMFICGNCAFTRAYNASVMEICG